MRAESLSPERRREIATIASAAAVEARKRIPERKLSEMAKKAAAVRWGKKRDRGGAALDARPPSDTESSAHRSEGDTQDAAAGRPPIPGEDGSAVPDSTATARDMYTESQLLRQQLFLQRQAQPPAQAFDRSSYRPVGPGDCMIHPSTQRCQKCGATVTPVHIMTRLIGGSFCERCCPACHPAS
jgi:hypothetical protein